jgi:hypothetical protein
MENTETKVCSKCGFSKPLSDFYFRKDMKDFRNECIECCKKNISENQKNRNKIYWKEYRDKNREMLRNKRKLFTSNNKELILLWLSRGRAKKKGIQFDIDVSDIVIPNICPVLGIPIYKDISSNRGMDNSPSLDRIDNSKGYVKGNVMVISFRANKLKGDASIDELKKILVYMESQCHTPAAELRA